MNVELLRKIAAVIQEKPDQFHMYSWHSCGTTHCIGGWAEVLTGAQQTDSPEKMAKILDIEFVPDGIDVADEDGILCVPESADDCQAGRLFYKQNWPDQFQAPSYRDPSNAAARIEHFIATEGRE